MSRRCISARITAPAASVRARSGASPCSAANSAEGRLRSILSAAASSSSPSVRVPTRRFRPRALPPTASAVLGSGKSRPSQCSRTTLRASRIVSLPGRVVVEDLLREAQRADVERTQPDRAEIGRADGELRRAATDVADRDGVAVDTCARDRAVVGKPCLLVAAKQPDGRLGGHLEAAEKVAAVLGLATGRGDQGLDVHAAELPRLGGELGHGPGGGFEAQRRDRAGRGHVGAQTDPGRPLLDGLDRASADAGDEQPDRVRPDVDDGEVHPGFDHVSRCGGQVATKL